MKTLSTVQQRVEFKINIYHLVQANGPEQTAADLYMSVDRTMNIFRAAQRYQGHVMNLQFKPNVNPYNA